MDLISQKLLGVFTLFGLFLGAYTQCDSLLNCQVCTSNSGGDLQCLTCEEGFAQSEDLSGCCSRGCVLDGNSFHACNTNTGRCTYGCRQGFIRDTCVECNSVIDGCENCKHLEDNKSLPIHCITCVTNLFVTTNKQACCPLGCDTCNGNVCTSCKQAYFLYNDACDQCGNNCVPPEDGSARCDSVTGECLLGCLDGWHGSKCDVFCDLSRCNLCTYNEPRQNLTCQDCEAGFYGPYCVRCNANCADTGSNEICEQDGTCLAGCKPGYRGNKCDIACESAVGLDKCTVCDRYEFTCTACKPGYWGNTCQNECNSNCVSFEGQRTCAPATGRCDFGCLAGFYKDDCSGSCPNCLNDVCDRTTGNCRDPFCEPGFHGSNCNFTCPANCANDPVTNEAHCDFNYGNCTHGCIDGKWGQFCNQGCSINCALSPQGTESGPLCAQRNGVCLHKCKPGYYEETCTTPCRSQCVDDNCDIQQGTCLECNSTNPGYLCPSGKCPPVSEVYFNGLFCNITCPENCDSTCVRYSAICDSCKAGFWSNFCDQECGNCKDVICFQNNGTCLSECVDGFYGPRCDQKCRFDGCQSCDRLTGNCATCKQGLWGGNCASNCSTACLPDSTGHIFCDKETSNCDIQACVVGYFSPQCRSECGANCLPSDISPNLKGSCDFIDGVCDDGCTEGWYGDFCDTECSSYCVNGICDRNGRCNDLLGCVPGRYGFSCSEICANTCNDGKCDRETGNCAECSKPYEEQSPLCRSAACSPRNKWGVFCEFDCSSFCADGTCSRDDGSCSSCITQKFGRTCESDCPHCGTDVCYQSSGICVDKCDPGWYQLNCSKECKHQGCQECDRTNGDCISCKIGKYGTDCSSDCAATCASGNGVITCNRFSGECDSKTCQPGFYTPQCTERCSQYCRDVSCDIEAGTCEPCLNGWYGQRCNEECSSNCKNKDCVVSEANCRQGCIDGKWGASCEKDCNFNCDSKACNKDTAECLFGCTASKFYGLTCASPCNGNCIDDVCNRTGYCLRGCEVGWYGDECQYECSAVSKCTDGTCSRLEGTCEDCSLSDPGPNCPSADCPHGKRGDSCDEDCTSDNCLYDQCGRYTDNCQGCPTGFYGMKCEFTCSHCKPGTGCDQTTGECVSGCQDGWYRPDCETQCSSVCGSCERQSGDCITCAAGRWGTQCQSLCSSNCVETRVGENNLVFCNKTTGFCTEKACKVGFWREDCTQACNSNCLPDENNNRVCAYLDGKCLKGCVATFYGDTCSSSCSARCKDRLCTDFEDTCDISCAEGFYGATCSGTCSSHCAGTSGCDPRTGQCFEGCKLGYYGTRCDDPCKNTCVDGTCNSEGSCPDCASEPVGANCRIQVCNATFYGPTCESKCPGDYCLGDRCKRISGECENGCRFRYYGAFCTGECQCDFTGTEECEQVKGECICKAGRHGLLCNQICSEGCRDFTCERDGTCTNGCKEGRFGSKCEDSCDNCRNKQCNAANGNCLQGCEEGWYGSQCNLPCNSVCKTCDIQTGACTACVDNYYDLPSCSGTCSNNCFVQGVGRQCNQADGHCLYGCRDGYYSPDCSESCGNCDDCDPNDGSCPVCRAGWWGTTCKQQCSSTCARGGSSNQRLCRQSDGYCEFGCEAGYYGGNCGNECIGSNCLNSICDRITGRCSRGCMPYYYDTNCDQRCDSCRDGNCEQANGNCISDCPPNLYGIKCAKDCLSICSDGTCDKYTGYCADCQTSPKGKNCAVQDAQTAPQEDEEVISLEGIIGITLGAVAVVIIFVIIIVCCINYKRRYDDAKTEIHLPSDVIERLSTHRSLHSTTSTNYPVARVVGDDNEKDFVLF